MDKEQFIKNIQAGNAVGLQKDLVNDLNAKVLETLANRKAEVAKSLENK